jgi:hypothetical protein
MSGKLKLGLAAAFALLATAVALWAGARSLGVGRTVRSASAAQGEPMGRGPSEMESGPGANRGGGPGGPGWVSADRGGAGPGAARSYSDEFSFPTAAQAMIAFKAGVEDLALRAEQESSLGTLGIVARRGLIEAYRLWMEPLIAGDREGFERSVSTLGGETAAAGALFDRLTGYLGNARIDLASAQIVSRDGASGEVPVAAPVALRGPGMGGPGGSGGVVGVPMMMGISVTRDDATGEMTRVRQLDIPLSSVFPDVAERAREGALEVWAPAKLADGRGRQADIGPSVFFVRQGEHWRPVAMRVALVSEQAATKLDEMMRARGARAQD